MTDEQYNKYLNTNIQYLKGVGENRSRLLNKLSIYNIWDILYFFPRDYEDRRKTTTIRDAIDGEKCCIKAIPMQNVMCKRIKKGIVLYYLYVDDGTDSIYIKWFSSDKYPVNIKYGEKYIFYGKPVTSYGKREFELEVMEMSENRKYTQIIVPVYPLTKGLNQNQIRNLVTQVLSKVEHFPDIFPIDILKKYDLMSLDEAIRQMHFPNNHDAFARAKKRLVFEELFILQLALLTIKDRRKKKTSCIMPDTSCREEFFNLLPFTLTHSQIEVIDEICTDLGKNIPMNRLVQGDVGSGKTCVAACAMFVAAKNGFQSALMAPTEILASQHFDTFTKLLGKKAKIALLTGSVKGKEKKSVIEGIKNGEYDIVIGTHALIEKNVEFKNLGLCVTDEQHRFGVSQRAMLAKNSNCHTLVMSATPIPRTLALILYGDLDISIINAMPKGRQPIDTFCVGSNLKTRAYNFVKKQIEEGRQAYIICPLVEESEKLSAKASVEYSDYLAKNIFCDYKVGLLHGKMKPSEKEQVMKSFKNGDIDVLVSTTVIEVGVDVPNANIIVIENAERFGLSQLHQLRGRVGRGTHKSYCILFTDSDNEITRERTAIMTRTNDGFKIAQKDLDLRGCGEFFGTRQHGLPEMKIANLFTDADILKNAQNLCNEILSSDPDFSSEKYKFIREKVQNLFSRFGNADIFN